MSRQVLNVSRGDSRTSPGSLRQGSVTLKVEKLLLIFSWNFPCCSLCPLPPVLSLGTTGRSPAPSSCHPPLRCWYARVRPPSAFSSSTAPALPASPHQGGAPGPSPAPQPPLGPPQQLPVSRDWGAQRWAQHSRWASPARAEGQDQLPAPAGHAAPNAPQGPTRLLGHRATAGPRATGCPPAPPGPSPQSCPPAAPPQPVLVQGLSLPRAGPRAGPCGTPRGPLPPALQPAQASLRAARPAGVPAVPPSLCHRETCRGCAPSPQVTHDPAERDGTRC